MTVALVSLVVVGATAGVAVATADCAPYQLIKDLGFPAAVAAFLLVRLEPRIAKLTDSLHRLSVEIALARGARADGTDRE